MKQGDFARLGWIFCSGGAKRCAPTAADSVRRYPWLISALFYIWLCHPAMAQIRADDTLPENSTVTRQGNTSVIRQGTRRGRNLFHSFERFSIPRNQSAVFQDLPSEVENIFARVTGSDRSLINGLLEAQQTGGNLSPANFFLLNPNGIIFGENASLNIGGSFIASTADRIQFADGFQFSAVNSQVQPLLSVQVPVGLQLGPTPGTISNRATASLSVRPGRTIALIGGPITFVGGGLTAEAGRIELAAASSGRVSLRPAEQGWRLENKVKILI
jgi:filamentous hemagglutinin family protein